MTRQSEPATRLNLGPRASRELHVIPVADSINSFGGPTTIGLGLAAALVDQGVSVTVVSCYQRDKQLLTDMHEKVTHLQFASWRVPGSNAPGAVLSVRFALWIFLNVRKFDAVVIHGVREPVSFCAAFVALIFRRPYVIFCHGMLAMVTMSPYMRLCAALLSKARAVFALTQTEQRQVQLFAPRARVGVLTNAVAPIQRPVHVQGESDEKEYDVIFVGRLHPRKGVRIFAEAIDFALSNGIALKALIVGPDEGEGHIAQGLVDRWPEMVTWARGLSATDARDAMRSSKVLVAVAEQEPYGLVVVEAFVERVAVILGTGYEMAETWISAGVVVPTDSSAENVVLAVRSLSDERARDDLTQRAVTWANDHASFSLMIARLEELWQ